MQPRPLAVSLAMMAWAVPGVVRAECDNPCGTAPGGVCLSFLDKGRGVQPGRVLRRGADVRLLPYRQIGECGGLTALSPDEVHVAIATSPDGPFAALAAKRAGSGWSWQPSEPGLRYVLVTAPGRGDYRTTVLVIDDQVARAAVRLDGATPQAYGELRFVPKDANRAVAATFDRVSWPRPFAGRLDGLAQPLALVPGEYEAEWTLASDDGARAVVAWSYSGAPTVELKPPTGTLRILPAPISTGVLVEVSAASGAVARMCRVPGDSSPLVFQLPFGPARVSFYPGTHVTAGTCRQLRPREAAAAVLTAELTQRTPAALRWPPLRQRQTAP
jgi:hypothetical protein